MKNPSSYQWFRSVWWDERHSFGDCLIEMGNFEEGRYFVAEKEGQFRLCLGSELKIYIQEGYRMIGKAEKWEVWSIGSAC